MNKGNVFGVCVFLIVIALFAVSLYLVKEDGITGAVSISAVSGSTVTIETISAGATLTINGVSASEGDVFNFTKGDTVNLTTTFRNQTFEDIIESHYDINVSVHAINYPVHPGSTIYLDTALDYTPYDIFIITSNDATLFSFGVFAPPANNAIKIIGLHAIVQNARMTGMGSVIHTGTPTEIAEVFYGTVENNGTLSVRTASGSLMGSSFNKIVGNNVIFGSGSSDGYDIMIQEIYADYIEAFDTEITWWRMEAEDQFYVDDFDGAALNDELPEQTSLQDDDMLWFKARNPAKWSLYPLTKLDGTGNSFEFDNYIYGDYNFWEMQLGGDFYWYNDDDFPEYGHFIGPVMEMDSWFWQPYDDMYINFFGDNDNNYDTADRFDGDYGSAGSDYWNVLLTNDTPNGYNYTDGSIISPVFLFILRDGYLEAAYYDSYFSLGDEQDILIVSGTNNLTFYESDLSILFEEGTDSHWVVEDNITYIGNVPTDFAFNITIINFTRIGPNITVIATNDYDGEGMGDGIGEDFVSTMYLAYRAKTDYGQQLTRVYMDYNATSSQWSGNVTLPKQAEYYFYTVATEDDEVYGKLIEHVVDYVVDTTAPTITINNPLNGSDATSSNLLVLLNVTFSETVNESWYAIDSVAENITICNRCDGNVTDISFNSYGQHAITVWANDSNKNLGNNLVSFTLVLDTDNDGNPDTNDTDDDNDGVDDDDDQLTGNLSNVNSNVANLYLTIDGTTNLTGDFNGTKEVKFTNTTDTIVEFNYDFDTNTLDLGNVSIQDTSNATTGSILIAGIDLAGTGQTKTVYLTKVNAGINGICIEDAEITSIVQLTGDCSEAGEVKVECDGAAQGSYTCTYNATSNRYKVEGLVHSGVKQISYSKPAAATAASTGGGGGSRKKCTSFWDCSLWNQCIDGLQTRNCTDLNRCSPPKGKPEEQQGCIEEVIGEKPVEKIPAKEVIVEEVVEEKPVEIKEEKKQSIWPSLSLLIIIWVTAGVFVANRYHKKQEYKKQQKKIKQEIHKEVSISEYNQKLDRIIEKALKQGYSKEELRKELIDKDWAKDFVDKELKEF